METIEELQRYRLPYHSTKVPRDIGGIYFFTLRFPSDYELGLDAGNTSSYQNAFQLVKNTTDDDILNFLYCMSVIQQSFFFGLIYKVIFSDMDKND